MPEAVKSERLARVFERSEALLRAHLEGLVGSTQRVLIEGRDKGKGVLWSGRTKHNGIVHVTGADASSISQAGIVSARVVRSNKHSLEAELTDAARASARPLSAESPPTNKGARRALPMLAVPQGAA